MQLNSIFLRKYGKLLLYSLIFWAFYIGALIQGWKAFFLLLIPLSQYLLFVWLQILSVLKTPYTVAQYSIDFTSLGNTKTISHRFLYCSIAELLLIIVMGIESLYHPQLVNNHFILYILPIMLIFIFSTFFSMHTIINDSKVEFSIENRIDHVIQLNNKQKKVVFGYLILIFTIVSLILIGFSILGHFGIFTSTIFVPASIEQLNISYMLIIVEILAFFIPIALFLVVHRVIIKETIGYVTNLPENPQKIYIEMIKNYSLFPRFFKAWL